MSISIGGKIVTDGLVMHYDALNNRSYPGSGITWYDLTPYNNTASLDDGNNPVTIANGYASFVADYDPDPGEGNNRFMFVEDIVGINTTTQYATVDMWAKVPSNLGVNGTGIAFLFGFRVFYGVGFEEGNGIPDGQFGFVTDNSDVYGIDDLSYIQNNLLDRWVHYSFVACDNLIASSSQKIYINSVPLSLSQVAGSEGTRELTNTSVGYMAFGTRRNNAPQRTTTYDAALIKVYNRELTQAEVTQNFNAHKGRFNIY
jgi:hypothetical protein